MYSTPPGLFPRTSEHSEATPLFHPDGQISRINISVTTSGASLGTNVSLLDTNCAHWVYTVNEGTDMRWKNTSWDWKRKFAILPVNVGDQWIWLEFYWSKFQGDYYNVSLGKEKPCDWIWSATWRRRESKRTGKSNMGCLLGFVYHCRRGGESSQPLL